MAAHIVNCAKLRKELPGIDTDTPEGDRAYKMVMLIAGREMADRVRDTISAEAMEMWNDHMRMVMNEFRLDATSDEANRILKQFMEQFFFGEEQAIPNYVPPKQ